MAIPQLRGCAAEACFKALAVAAFRRREPVMPTEYFVKYDNGIKEKRRDVSILEDMWVVCKEIVAVLASHGITLHFAQSTYHRRVVRLRGTEDSGNPQDNGCNAKDQKNSFCVDLTIAINGKIFWLEFKYTEAGDWTYILGEAEQSVEFWKHVLTKPRTWRLDDRLGGAVLKPPHGLGTLIANFTRLRLELKCEGLLLENELVEHSRAHAVPARPKRLRVGVDNRTAADKHAQQHGRVCAPDPRNRNSAGGCWRQQLSSTLVAQSSPSVLRYIAIASHRRCNAQAAAPACAQAVRG